MTTDKPDRQRRLLLIATTAIGAAGLGLTTIPFVRSMLPSARAQALGGPVEINFAGLEEGQMLTVSWRSKPIWILNRSKETLKRLTETSDLLVDPESLVESQQPPYAQNINRSIRPELLVVIGVCTHLGCIPGTRFAVGEASGLGESWPGGYFCACHGSKFDLAGRVFKNVPAPTNLVIPPHRFLSETSVFVGEHPTNA